MFLRNILLQFFIVELYIAIIIHSIYFPVSDWSVKNTRQLLLAKFGTNFVIMKQIRQKPVKHTADY